MGQPTPPGDNVPLYDGLDASWNDIVGAFPEDKRAELAPLLKSRIDAYEPLKAYEDFHKSGVDPETIGTALSIYSVIENNPKQVYDSLGQHLGLTPKEVKEAVETMEENIDEDDPRISTLQKQVETLTQIALAQREQTSAQKLQQEQEAALEKEFNSLKQKYGDDFDEEEIVMRMIHKNLTAEQAYQEYAGKVSELRKRRPAPMLMGNTGAIPAKAIDPTKLDTKDTKSLVAQMIQHANQQR